MGSSRDDCRGWRRPHPSRRPDVHRSRDRPKRHRTYPFLPPSLAYRSPLFASSFSSSLAPSLASLSIRHSLFLLRPHPRYGHARPRRFPLPRSAIDARVVPSPVLRCCWWSIDDTCPADSGCALRWICWRIVCCSGKGALEFPQIDERRVFVELEEEEDGRIQRGRRERGRGRRFLRSFGAEEAILSDQ
jgi:hypothetical protein